MTISVKSFEEKIGDRHYEAYWCNDGTFLFCEDPKEQESFEGKTPEEIHNIKFDKCFRQTTLCILPSEMKKILEDGSLNQPPRIRPGLLPMKSEISAWSDGDLITIKEIFVLEMYITLPKQKWQEMTNACIKERNATYKAWGNKMIEPLVGKSVFMEEMNDNND